jgi:tRNA U34 5-methylaminomethyl-2-thiouridine-forming methyltransferase MnmC
MNLTRTEDGSFTLTSPHHGAPYHSLHGAVAESRHVFVAEGLDVAAPGDGALRVFEFGFGTGLNAGLAWQWSRSKGRELVYTGIEPFPVEADQVEALRHHAVCGLTATEFAKLHDALWQENPLQAGGFEASVHRLDWAGFACGPASLALPPQDVVFYDAFAPSEQPDLWTRDQFREVGALVKEGGLLVTYCAKGEVRRALEEAGWAVERLPGPPGKREMLRATKRSVTRFNVRVYAVIFDAKGERVLLSREDLPGGLKVKFPGGGLELGEGVRDALDREMAEELGPMAVLKHVTPLYTTDFFVRSAFRLEDQILSIYFTAQFEAPDMEARFGHKFRAVEGGEVGLAFKWRKVQDLDPADLHFPIDRHILPLIREAAVRMSAGA